MNLFKKKNQQEKQEEKSVDIKQLVLNALNEKLNGTIYDDCVIMPKGFTIDVVIGKQEKSDAVLLLQTTFIIKNDDFDEPIIDPVDSQGKTEEEAAKMAVEIFFGGVWHPLNQSIQKKNPIPVSVNFLMQHYDFDMYAQSIVKIGKTDNQPSMLMNYIKAQIPKYLGSKKYYWIRVYLARFKDKKIIEVRINGTICAELAGFFNEYLESWGESDRFVAEKQYAIFVNRADDECPFTKKDCTDAANAAIEMMENCKSADEYREMVKKLDEMCVIKQLSAEVRIFVPEIMSKLIMGYKEGDSLFLMQDGSKIEFKKTQLRSYYYIQQAILQYLSKQPPKENVMRIVANSVAFKELRKAHEAGHEPKDLYVPGTAYHIADENYKVW
ncbi:MAG: DUF6348 family protein [Ruminococcus sp.]